MGDASSKRGELKLWLRDRMTEGERPQEEWRQLWEATWDHLLVTPVRDLVDARQPVDRLLPPEAQEKLQGALARPGLVHPDWVRAMFRGEAAEAVLNDALYRALKDFSTLLPRLLVKVSPVGRFGILGSAGAFAEKLIVELEKLIEPEIKSFLANSTERILERAAEFTIAKIDDPASIEFRATFVNFMLSKSPSFFLEAANDEMLGDMGAVVEITARHLAETPEMQAGIRGWIDRVMDYSADKTLGEVLQIDGSGARPPIDALADATWPAFTNVLGSPQAQAWMDSLLDELIDEYEKAPAGR
ncbi:MAG: hypothetical protein JRH14_04775 [Deltaproteobacteria bacterium]|nr:hypothetical protein [Deltaproteobacteria bacterium]